MSIDISTYQGWVGQVRTAPAEYRHNGSISMPERSYVCTRVMIKSVITSKGPSAAMVESIWIRNLAMPADQENWVFRHHWLSWPIKEAA